jgi:predicted CoA-binding protein
MASKPTVAVIGASSHRHKYGNKSLRAHLKQGYEVFPVNPHETEIEGLKAYSDLASVPVEALDRITVYVPSWIGIHLLEAMAAKNPKEVWFNPGSESEALMAKAEALGLPTVYACSIIDIGSRPSDFGDE